jgi:alpha-tubulin suppressor-like RCC1 family protein
MRLAAFAAPAPALALALALAAAACDSGDDPRPATIVDAGGADVIDGGASDAPVDAPEVDAGEPVLDASPEPIVCAVTPCAVEIAAGASSACVRLNDGTVRCWGSNAAGELGRGPDAPLLSGTPAPVGGLANVTQLAGAASDPSDVFCARRADGTAVCWGSNAGGVLGRVDADGAVVTESSPEPAAVNGVSGATGVFVGPAIGCATFADPHVTCWGTNTAAQIPGAPFDAPLPATTIALGSPVIELAVADRGTIARASSGGLVSWGLGGDPLGPNTSLLGREVSLDQAPPGALTLARVSALAAGPTRACAIANGAVYCWGPGPTPGSDSVLPTPAGLGDAIAVAQTIAVGPSTACATLSDGSTWCWGDNTKGQLGAGDADLRPVPVPVLGLAARAVRMATMNGATCAILVSGAVQCWGRNDKGQLGRGTVDALAHFAPQNVELQP